MNSSLRPGTAIRFHGGWDGTKERCPACNFQCGYINVGVIVDRMWTFDGRTHIRFQDPDVWMAKIDTGAYVYGQADQFEVIEQIDPATIHTIAKLKIQMALDEGRRDNRHIQ